MLGGLFLGPNGDAVDPKVVGPTTSRSSTEAPRPADMLLGTYLGSHSFDEYRATFNQYPDVETIYLNAEQVATPHMAKHVDQIDRGISPIITLGYRNGPFTRAEIARWGPMVRIYYRNFVAGLDALARYAKSKRNGTKVYFADEHEAVVKINQGKYSFSGYGSAGRPAVRDSAAAWNRVMRYVRDAAPDVVRVYWYGGSGTGEDAFADDLEADLVQMATFDPYRWKHDRSTDTAEELWGAKIDHLMAQPWMRRSDGSLKPWGLTEWGTDTVHGDAANARFVADALRYLRFRGATLAVYFSRVDGNDSSNNFMLADSGQPQTLQAYREALAE